MCLLLPVIIVVFFSQADPTKDLTFNLKLTDDEKQARSNLKLPYMFHEEKTSEVTINRPGEGRVFYQPDEADDFDEEDPDDDLDIWNNIQIITIVESKKRFHAWPYINV